MEGSYYKTKVSVDEYIQLAKGVDGSQLIEKLVKILPQNSDLLELGSGPGADWRILNEIYDVTGSDFSAEFLTHLKKENPAGEFIHLDAITLNTNKRFDGIYSNKVMHHLNDKELATSIKQQHAILNAKGIICHSFWKGAGSEVFKGLFVKYHDEDSLIDNFQEFFEIISIESYKEFEDNDSLLLIGKKK